MTVNTGWNGDPNYETALRSPGDLPPITGEFATTYNLLPETVDHTLARKLYYNRDLRYKLGAGFSRPIIDVPAGFMGVPSLVASTAGGDEQAALDEFMNRNKGQSIKAHRMLLRDGEVLLRLQPSDRSPAYAKLFTKEEDEADIVVVPTEAFKIISKDEDIGAIEAVRIKHVFMTKPEGTDHLVESAIYETITADTILFEYPDGDSRDNKTVENPLGFVPAVHLENESESGELHASSDLEPAEPYMRFYNDVMLHAGSASLLHSTAKLIIRAQNVDAFVKKNFSEAEIQDGVLKFKNKDVLMFESGEPEMIAGGSQIYQQGADIIQARAPL